MAHLYRQTTIWDGAAKLKALLFQHCLLLPCVLITWYSFRGSPFAVNIAQPLLRASYCAYGILATLLGLTIFPGIDLPDESAYLFQAKALQGGQLSVEAPSVIIANTEWRKALSFDHHIIHQGRWFGKYPPGWPLLLSLWDFD